MSDRIAHLRDVLRLSTEYADMQDDLQYQQLTALPDCRGIVVKTIRRGTDLSGKPQLTARVGQFMIARFHRQKGLWGFVPPGLNHVLIPYSYHVFDLNPIVNPDYFAVYIHTEGFRRAVFEAARKSGRLYLRSFGVIPLWLPPRDVQDWIVGLLRAGQDVIVSTLSMLEAVRQIKQRVAADLFGQINPSWEATTLGTSATIMRTGHGQYPIVVTPAGKLLQDAAITTGAAAIMPHAEMNIHFLIYWLENVLPRLNTPVTTAMESLPLMLPTLYEQQKFASVLAQHDEAINALYEECAALESLLSRLQDLIFSGDSLALKTLATLSQEVH